MPKRLPEPVIQRHAFRSLSLATRCSEVEGSEKYCSFLTTTSNAVLPSSRYILVAQERWQDPFLDLPFSLMQQESAVGNSHLHTFAGSAQVTYEAIQNLPLRGRQ